MNHHRLLCAGVLLSASVSLATPDYQTMDQIAEKNRQLSEEETALRRRYMNLDAVHRAFALLQQSQDEVIFGKSGLYSRADAWHQSVLRWFTQWQQLTTVMTQVNETNVFAMAQEFDELTRKLLATYGTLRDDAQKIATLAATKRADLAAEAALPLELIAGYRDHIDRLNQQRTSVIGAYQSFESTFADRYVQNLIAPMAPIRDALDAKMRRLALQFPELNATVRQARQLLQLVDTIAPLTQSLVGLSDQVSQALNQDRVFFAEQTLMQLRKDASALRQKIAAFTIHEPFKQAEINRLDAALNAAETHFQNATRTFAKSAIVARYVDRERRNLTRICRQPEQQALFDCELLRTLNAIKVTPSELRTWSEVDLAYLEQQIQRVKSGPSILHPHDGAKP